MKPLLPRLLVLLLPLAAVPAARAQASVALNFESQTLYVGEPAIATLEVRDFQSCDPPTVPELPGANFRLLDKSLESSQMSIINGRMTQSRTVQFRLELTPRAVGELTVPPVAISVDGKQLSTNPVTLAVRPSDADDLFAVEITSGRNRVYVGQRINLTMTVWVRPPRYGNRTVDPGAIVERLNAINFGPFPTQVSNATSIRRQRTVNGKQELFYAFDFTTAFLAEKPGRLAFDDLQVGLAYPVPGGTRHLRAQPRVEPLEVLPVPSEGRPATFAGAVGLFDIEVAASPTEVRVGDPIELTIDLFGDGPLETLPPPLLSANQALLAGFRLPSEELAGEVREGRRRFHLTIRARSDVVTAIPAIEYPYFDPDAERFVTARSAPIPLRIIPTTETPVPEPAVPVEPGIAASDPALQPLDGLRDIETNVDVLLARPPRLTTGLVATTLVGPPALFTLVWAGQLLMQARAANPARRRRAGALNRAAAQLTLAAALPARERAAAVQRALLGYLADRTGEPPARFDGQASAAWLEERGVPAELCAVWATLMQRCDAAVFGAADEDDQSLTRQALACLRTLERNGV